MSSELPLHPPFTRSCGPASARIIPPFLLFICTYSDIAFTSLEPEELACPSPLSLDYPQTQSRKGQGSWYCPHKVITHLFNAHTSPALPPFTIRCQTSSLENYGYLTSYSTASPGTSWFSNFSLKTQKAETHLSFADWFHVDSVPKSPREFLHGSIS